MAFGKSPKLATFQILHFDHQKLVPVLNDTAGGKLKPRSSELLYSSFGLVHDASLALRPEAYAAAVIIELKKIFDFRGAVTVAHPVKTGEVGTCLRRRQNVVDR